MDMTFLIESSQNVAQIFCPKFIAYIATALRVDLKAVRRFLKTHFATLLHRYWPWEIARKNCHINCLHVQ